MRRARSIRSFASSPLVGEDNATIALSDSRVRWGVLRPPSSGLTIPPTPALPHKGGGRERNRRTDVAGEEALAEAEEELADIATLDLVKSNLSSGATQVLPPEVCRRLLAGQGRLQAIREWRGQDRAAVAAHLRLDEATLARIEADRLPLDADTASRVAVLFDVPADWVAG
jgi:hypothetical protein